MTTTSSAVQDLADALNNTWEKWTEEILSWLNESWNGEPALQPVRLPETKQSFRELYSDCNSMCAFSHPAC